ILACSYCSYGNGGNKHLFFDWLTQVPKRFLSSLVVILGEHDILTDRERLKPEMRRVKRMIVHRHYNPQNFDNDIALLELDPPVIFRPHISPICLPEPDDDFTGKSAFVTGWGKTTHGGAIPNLLQEVQVPIMSNADCVEMFKEAGHSKLIKPTFLCAGYKSGGKGLLRRRFRRTPDGGKREWTMGPGRNSVSRYPLCGSESTWSLHENFCLQTLDQ
ncbi:unnamed protein product, partial [Larinioides sclopetarius]